MINSGITASRRVARPAQRALHIVSDGEMRRAALPVMNEFDDLFGSLTTHLREAAAECPITALRLKERILDCVATLENAHTKIMPGIARQLQLESTLRSVSLALAEAKAELAHTQIREKEARHQAMHDALTTLPNRRYFQQSLESALSSVKLRRPALAALYIDLNGFKAMNDAHGHHTGDHLLRIVAARLRNSMRAGDMVCRLGGDEFGCLLTGMANRRQISQVAIKIFNLISAPIRIGAVTLVVLPSIGIAVAPGDGATSEVLLHRADAAMYHAKRYQTCYTFYREVTSTGIKAGEPSAATF